MASLTQRPRFGLGVPNGGDFADPVKLAALAATAERSGWDGVFIWDHLVRRQPWAPMVDPWIALAAMAVATEHVLLGPMITPLPRRRAAVVARQTVTLDHLSGGRLRFGVGLGAPDDEFTRFGESADRAVRAAMLDESIDLLRALWTGEPVDFAGEHLTAEGVTFQPTPVNGDIPIWVGGGWPNVGPMRRAARCDGVWPNRAGGGYLDVEEFGECVAWVQAARAERETSGKEFDACFPGQSSGPDDEAHLDEVGRLAAVGMTWWIEHLDDPSVAFEQHLERVVAGPAQPF